MHTLRFRQVHLDFHTNGDIPKVGSKFSKRRFQEALKRGHIDSVTLFSKCHHGWSYHPTKVGKTHPHLKRNLLAEQIEACLEIGVRCPIYLSAGLDEVTALEHPEWLVVDSKGGTRPPLSASWKVLRFNSPYLDYLCAQIEEVVRLWPENDGIFLDIIAPRLDYSRESLESMRAAGLDPNVEADCAVHAQKVLLHYYERTTTATRVVNAETPIFHNGGHIPVGAHRFNFFNSHFELESLPTGGWGYDHFPFSARYAITQPRDFLGMTGKFHGTWGEFGGFKRSAALRYECAAMVANGAKCSIGDQLHPSGEMNPDTYSLIGGAYKEVESKEPWLTGVQHAARIALVSAEQNQASARGHHNSATFADEGVARMLLELHLPFVILDEQADWKTFELVILPDSLVLNALLLKKAQNHLKSGGRILAAGGALLTAEQDDFAVNPGAEFKGRSAFDPDYLLATALSDSVPVRSPIVIAGGAYEISPAGKTGVLAERRIPYFNRTWEHFCSHQHAPDSPAKPNPAAIISDQIAYFSHNIFTQYRATGQPLYRDFILATLKQLFPEGLPVETNLPTVARFNLLEQQTEGRYVAHLLYAPITLRAQTGSGSQSKPMEIIEDLIPLHERSVTLRLKQKIRAVNLAPTGQCINFEQTGDRVTFNVPKFTCHQMVVLSYRD